MRFFGIPDPELRSRGFGIGIFYFGLDRKIPKIPKSLRSGSGFENPEKFRKSRKNPESKIPKIPKSQRLVSGCENLKKIPKKSQERNPESPIIPEIGIQI